MRDEGESDAAKGRRGDAEIYKLKRSSCRILGVFAIYVYTKTHSKPR